MSDKPKDFGVICEHGGLKRKCDSCALIEREGELDAAEAEIARLHQRIADLEAAEPVAAVLQAQIDDVAEATVDYPIPSSMDVRRHPITQCLIAAIVDNARLREREREVYNRLDLIMKFIRPRTVVAQMYQDAPDA